MARTPDGTIVQSPAFPPTQIIDSLGAGDTFTAAVLHYLNHVKLKKNQFNMVNTENTDQITKTQQQSDQDPSSSNDNIAPKKITINCNIESLEYSNTDFIDQTILQAAITFACRTAGNKIGFKGYDHLQSTPVCF